METSGTYFQPFFVWLVRTTLQASVLVCLILLIQAVLGNKLGIRWRYCLWLVLLVRMALPWAPQSRMSMFNLLPQSLPRESARPIVRKPSAASPASGLAAQDSTAKPESASAPLSDRAEGSLASSPGPQKPGVSQERQSFDLSKMAGVLPLLWLAGAGALGGYIVVNNIRLWRIVQRERPLTDQKILDLLEDCKNQIGTRAILAVVATDRVSSPALFGFVRPRLLLPADMIEGLDLNELRYVFLHELAHLKRHDIFIGYAVSLLQVVHWFNPLVWLGFRQMQADRELAADGLAMSSMQPDETPAYGHTIVRQLERFLQPRRLPSLAGISENKAQMKRRMTMIAKFKRSSYRWSPLGAILLAVLGCVCLCNAKGGKSPDVSAAKPSPGMTLRQVRMESGGFTSLSPDGKYLCDVDWDTGNLVLSELATGNVRSLTDKGSWEQFAGYATISTISRDSKKVAFLWFNHEEQCFDLREIGLDGSGDRVVRRFLEKDQEMEWLEPAAWSPDGKQILVRFSIEEEHSQIAWVSTADGSVRTVKALNKSWPGKMDVSPDGRYIVYDLPQEEETSRRDIFAFDIEENREVALVQHPADDKFMGWTPDGRHIFFTSNRMASWDGWILPVARGEPSGLPELVKASIGDVSPIGFTPGGAFYYTPAYGPRGVYTAALDLQTGKVLSSPKPVRHAGTEELCDWSPDGRYLAYCTRPRGEKSQIVHIRSVETGQERQLDAKLPYFHWLRWSPDGRSILVAGLEEKNLRNVVYKVDVLTGERTVVLRTETGMIPGAALSPDGKALFYSHWDGAARSAWFMVRDLETGHEKQLVRAAICPHPYLGWALSPDGKQLAFILEFPAVRTLNTISTAGGQPKELLRMKEEQPSDVAWTRDSRNVLFMRAEALWRIPAEGGEPRKLWTWEKPHLSFEGICVHPDGRNLAFDVMEVRSEVWVIENFLPGAPGPVAKPADQPDFRQIRIPTKPGNGVLSPDGKKLAFVSKRSIWVVPVRGKVSPDIAGEPVKLTEATGVFRWGMRWSADGKWIAYNTLPSEDHVGICIVPFSGGKVKRVVNRYRAGVSIHNYLLGLSPDGKMVAFTSQEAGENQLFTVNVEGGDVNQLTMDGGTQPAFSPDGEKIAYVKEEPQAAEIRKSDVWVIPAAGGTPVQVSGLPGKATGPIWSPDGRMIAFTRKVTSIDMSKEICIVPVSETGNPEASPTQIELPLATWDFLAGWTPDNEIGVLLTNPDHYAIYTVPASGGNATQVTPQGYYFSPRWSPDGKRLYLRSPDGPDGIASVPSEGGEISIKPIDADSMIGGPLQWGGNVVSPDGKKIVFCASKKDNKSFPPSYIYTIPVEGGEPNQLTISPGRGRDRFPCWSPDGKSIAFIRYSGASWNKKKHDYINNICVVRPEGGEVRQLTSESDKVARATIAWSPDGKSIAYYSEDKTIRVIPVKGGESRELVEVDKVNEWWDELAWSRDGKKIAYSSKGSIWVVSLDGGEPEEVKTGLDAKATHISWSPDGKKIAFTASEGGDTELWLMENFLPKVVAKTSK